MQANTEVIKAAQEAWNDLTFILDEKPEIYEDLEEFAHFYETLVRGLFDDVESH